MIRSTLDWQARAEYSDITCGFAEGIALRNTTSSARTVRGNDGA